MPVTTTETEQKKALSDIKQTISKFNMKYEKDSAGKAKLISECEESEQDVINVSEDTSTNLLVVVKCLEMSRTDMLANLSNSFRKYKFRPILPSLTLIGVYKS